MYYIPKHFKLYELLPEDIFMDLGKSPDLGWLFFNPHVLITLDWLRRKYGPATVNDWHWGGENQYRGFRPFDLELGARYSQHKFGRAADIVFSDVTAAEVRLDCRLNPFDWPFFMITAVEKNVEWFHFDVRPHDKGKSGILLFGH